MQKLSEKLIAYGKEHLYLGELDSIYIKNLIMTALKLSEEDQALTVEELENIKNMTVPDSLIAEITSYAEANKLCDEGMELSFAAYIMGLLTPMPQALYEQFLNIKAEKGVNEACLYLYNLSIKNNYIQKTAIEKNIYWKAPFDNKFIEVTINLSKPEKDNKEIARMLAQPPSSYPKCMLCQENLGYSGNLTKPPRQNLRFIPITIDQERWYMQYSPYLYYEEHCILFSSEHRPMVVNGKTIQKLVDFVKVFPQYFAGSNASLPIVGGSILTHEHYQGGGYKMPVHYCGEYKKFDAKVLKNVEISIVDWYNSVVRLTSSDQQQVVSAGAEVINKWADYTDESVQIISHTDKPHNAVTPIVRKEGDKFIVDLILRNNLTSEQYPDGIYHAHPEYHNIKKEGIGLIEAMGMFILPGRLLKETGEIVKILCGEREMADDLKIHSQMVSALATHKYTKTEAEAAVREYINNVCKNILINTAVFKPDAEGRKAFEKFINILEI